MDGVLVPASPVSSVSRHVVPTLLQGLFVPDPIDEHSVGQFLSFAYLLLLVRGRILYFVGRLKIRNKLCKIFKLNQILNRIEFFYFFLPGGEIHFFFFRRRQKVESTTLPEATKNEK